MSDLAEQLEKFHATPAATTCRLIHFDNAQVRPGFVSDTWFLIVDGKKPWLTMDVRLQPLIYVVQPDYWEIEVVGCMKGVGLPATAPYHVWRDITHCRGKHGIVVVGAHERRMIDIP